jgi:hypothetical protein
MLDEVAEPVGVRRGPGARAVWRAGAGAAVLASVLFAFWGTPPTTSQDDFVRQLSAGNVATATLSHDSFGLEYDALRRTYDPDATILLWTDQRGKLYRAELRDLVVAEPTGEGDGPVDVVASIDATARAAGVTPPVWGEVGLAAWSRLPLGIVSLCFLGLLVFGSQLRRVTTWGMFWLLGVPLGVGLMWWVVRDAPFDPAMSARAEPRARQRGMTAAGVPRAGGGKTFLLAWVLSLGLAFVLSVLVGIQGSPSSSVSTEPVTIVRTR